MSDRDAAKDRLIGEGVLTVATVLTPGPLDDIAIAALRAGERALHPNSGKAISRFGVYEIWVKKELYKIGKAHMDRITLKTKLPTRVHQQVEKLSKIHVGKSVEGTIVDPLGEVSTSYAKATEKLHLYRYYNATGRIPPGNLKSFKP